MDLGLNFRIKTSCATPAVPISATQSIVYWVQTERQNIIKLFFTLFVCCCCCKFGLHSLYIKQFERFRWYMWPQMFKMSQEFRPPPWTSPPWIPTVSFNPAPRQVYSTAAGKPLTSAILIDFFVSRGNEGPVQQTAFTKGNKQENN